jgi:hypothetical protein
VKFEAQFFGTFSPSSFSNLIVFPFCRRFLFHLHLCFYGVFSYASAAPRTPADGTVSSQVLTHPGAGIVSRRLEGWCQTGVMVRNNIAGLRTTLEPSQFLYFYILSNLYLIFFFCLFSSSIIPLTYTGTSFPGIERGGSSGRVSRIWAN